MSILTLKKVTLVGLRQEKAAILQGLQALGVMHIIPLRATTEAAPTRTEPVSAQQLEALLAYLLNSPNKRRQVKVERYLDLATVVSQTEDNRQQRLALLERREFLKKRINDLTPWGDFRFPQEGELYDHKLWFYLLPNYRLRELQKVNHPWAIVHRDNRYAYVAVISPQEPPADLLSVARTHTGAVPLSALQHELEDVEVALETLAAEREALTRWIFLLQHRVAGIADQDQQAQVAGQTFDKEEIFALQGWVADTELAALQQFADEFAVVMQVTEADPNEQPPTRLQNPPALAAGEDVVHFFQMPGYRSWDPSRVVFFSFVAFFALILSDAGYALLLAGLLVFYWQRLGRSQSLRRLRAMSVALVLSGVVWGVLVGSYFGAAPPTDWLAAAHVVDLHDFDAMMRLSIGIGAGHLILANLMMAWVKRRQAARWGPLGWALACASLLWGWLQGFTLYHWLLAGFGLLLVLLFADPTARGWRRLLAGVLALTGLSKLFGDVLSYLRLFALGLASASLAITFNQLAVDVALALPGIGLLLKVLILLVGHLLNFVLTVVSGVIHGLRLNLIEFYNWSLADEGYAFKPFAKQEVLPWIT